MISEHLLQEAKARFGIIDSRIFDKVEYFYRPITLNEYKYIMNVLPPNATDAELEDLAVKIGVFFPANVDIDSMRAGHVSQLADEILRISGFTDLDYLVSTLAKYREQLEEATYMMKAFVIAAMPAYTEEDLDELPVELLIKKVAFAEKIITVQQAANGLPPEAAVAFAFGGLEQEETAGIDKEKLLSKIVETERETSGKVASRDVLREFDEKTLAAMSGTPKATDPIADKLRQSLY